MTALTFTEDGAGDGTVLSVSGEIDMQTVPELRSKVDDLDVAHRTLVLDLHGVEFVDSSGLGALLGIKKQQDRGGGRLVLARMSAPVARILQITRMDGVFTVADG
ncbi:STAS domain-containing protein [Aeromicrobium fastidiosum]|uniref:Anti-sigma factor antagonist n=1 Tax=Aeromicrobium fastidiosum TaxID=52699 RepID=A0A641AJB2_9ACTN|nr:STAS domain-containing protein [Aeromicrobium fastidiosum]KAA1374788.1 STAS domain-containing protein [Aeromicrobium fastidiosum]MBP2390661.1 anti-anti-sigma factor [Aeromicrobium fastidiosum]